MKNRRLTTLLLSFLISLFLTHSLPAHALFNNFQFNSLNKRKPPTKAKFLKRIRSKRPDFKLIINYCEKNSNFVLNNNLTFDDLAQILYYYNNIEKNASEAKKQQARALFNLFLKGPQAKDITTYLNQDNNFQQFFFSDYLQFLLQNYPNNTYELLTGISTIQWWKPISNHGPIIIEKFAQQEKEWDEIYSYFKDLDSTYFSEVSHINYLKTTLLEFSMEDPNDLIWQLAPDHNFDFLYAKEAWEQHFDDLDETNQYKFLNVIIDQIKTPHQAEQFWVHLSDLGKLKSFKITSDQMGELFKKLPIRTWRFIPPKFVWNFSKRHPLEAEELIKAMPADEAVNYIQDPNYLIHQNTNQLEAFEMGEKNVVTFKCPQCKHPLKLEKHQVPLKLTTPSKKAENPYHFYCLNCNNSTCYLCANPHQYNKCHETSDDSLYYSYTYSDYLSEEEYEDSYYDEYDETEYSDEYSSEYEEDYYEEYMTSSYSDSDSDYDSDS